MHSPGPWIVRHYDGDGGRPTVEQARPNNIPPWRPVAAVCHVFTRVAPGQPDDEAEANARLIAAAPALLEACRAVVANYRRAAEEQYDELAWSEFDGVDKLRAAIALAEGGGT